MEEMNEKKFVDLLTEAENTGHKAICLFEDIDGNWRGTMQKDKKVVFVRDIGPETVLQLLLTHNGK